MKCGAYSNTNITRHKIDCNFFSFGPISLKMVSKDSSESSNSDYICDCHVWTNGMKVIVDLVGSEFKCGAYSSTNTSIEGAKSHNFFVSQPISLKMVSKDSSESSKHFV